MDKIVMTGMQFYGYHGVFAEENKLGQKFSIDVELYLPLKQACETDDLNATVNYAEVYATIKSVVEGKPSKLIEALAERVASEVLHTYTSIKEITVRVLKPNPPFEIYFEGVTVEIHRKRA